MILKAQELYFVLHTSTIHKYEDSVTNSGQQDSTGAEGNRLVGAILLSDVRHAIFILVHNGGTEIKVELLGFQNHP
mgnify:CR=1 FL=1